VASGKRKECLQNAVSWRLEAQFLIWGRPGWVVQGWAEIGTSAHARDCAPLQTHVVTVNPY
jgi:hypothetical protein